MRPELRRILDDLAGLSDVLERAATRYVELSRVGGTVEVAPSERRAVERLGCRLDRGGRVKLADLDRAFRTSRLDAGLTEVLEELRGGPLVTRVEAREQEDHEWHRLTSRIRELDPPEWVARWLDEQESALRADWRRQGGDWSSALEAAVRAGGELVAVGEGTELPHLSYQACGDAHGLDADRTAGRLFERLLVHRHGDAGFSLPLSAEDREGLFALAGLAVDELSSTVHVAGLGGSDPLVAAGRAGRHVLILPLRSLYAIGDDVQARGGVAFAVENRSVLSWLHRRLDDVPLEQSPTLVCTGGHVSLATLRLLEALATRGAVVRYSGDFDARGLMIADALASRLGSAFRPWRMDAAAFFEALGRGGGGDRIDPGRFSRDAAARFPDLSRVIDDHGAAYQEGLSRLLLEDIRSWIEED